MEKSERDKIDGGWEMRVQACGDRCHAVDVAGNQVQMLHAMNAG